MTANREILIALDQSNSLAEKLAHLHESIRARHPLITRIALALYDGETDIVRTFIYSGETSPLNHYQAKLQDCFSLLTLAENNTARLEQDLAVFDQSPHLHAQKIRQAGYRSSYTLPIRYQSELLGFLFFNANEANAFDAGCISDLNILADLVALLLVTSLGNVRTLMSTVKSAIDLSRSRDPETANHLERMSRYARIIARNLNSAEQPDDQTSEYIYMFAPLHDIGKIAIPDDILLKPGKLTSEEYEVMKTHAEKGRDMARTLIKNYRLEDSPHLELLFNIIAHHHEAWDGSGYPDGLAGTHIPIEARIVTVADIFDALTSHRPYKEAWSDERALEELTRLSGVKLDPDCVSALINNIEEVTLVRQTFTD